MSFPVQIGIFPFVSLFRQIRDLFRPLKKGSRLELYPFRTNLFKLVLKPNKRSVR